MKTVTENNFSSSVEGVHINSVPERAMPQTFKKAYSNFVLKNPDDSALFKTFRRSESSNTMCFILFFFGVGFIIYRTSNSLANYPSVISLVSLAFTVLFSFVGGLCLILLNKSLVRNSNWTGGFSSKSTWLISLFELGWFISMNISISLLMIITCYNGICPTNDAPRGCNLSRENQMPDHLMIGTIVLPYIVSLIVKGIDFRYVLIMWFINLGAVIFCLLYFDLEGSRSTMIIFFPLTLLAMFENQRQILSIFHLTQAQKELLAENERVAAENHTSEMRHMIGNVAHDLKTPLTAFWNGVELIDTVLGEIDELETRSLTVLSTPMFQCQELLPNTNTQQPQPSPCVIAASKSLIREKIGTIKDSIGNMKNVNSFMLMSINRCIDFTKATNGLKLVPRLETIHLAEAVNLPLGCMKELQSRTVIRLNSISDQICPNIITDKQWLQENILCLLSNAVKYSTQGTVNINITLLPKDPALSSASPSRLTSLSESVAPQDLQESNPECRSITDNSTSIINAAVAVKSDNHSSYVKLKPSITGKASSPSKLHSFKIMPHSPYEVLALRGIASEDNQHRFSAPTVKDKSCGNSGPADSNHGSPSDKFSDLNTTTRNCDTQVTTPLKQRDYNIQVNSSPNDSVRSTSGGNSTVVQPMLKVEVEDTGIGLSEEVRSNLFKPFKQAQRLAGGTGLGLYSLAKRLEALGGKYGVDNRSDGLQGSVFWFAIPYRPDTTVEEKKSRQNCKITASSLSRALTNTSGGTSSPDGNMSPTHELSQYEKHHESPHGIFNGEDDGKCFKRSGTATSFLEDGLNILLVDDSFTILKMTRNMLVRKGHTVSTAENGVEAVERVAAQRKESHGAGGGQGCFDVVLMDLQMPVMDGLEATRRIRQEELSVNQKSLESNHLVSPDVSYSSLFGVGTDSYGTADGGFEIVEVGKVKGSQSFMKRPRAASIEMIARGSSRGNILPLGSSSTEVAVSGPVGIPVTPEANSILLKKCFSSESHSGKPRPVHQFIIGVSANSDSDTIRAAFVAGVDAFIPKPFTLQTFNDTYNQYCEALDALETAENVAIPDNSTEVAPTGD